jgi:hypothetical protein
MILRNPERAITVLNFASLWAPCFWQVLLCLQGGKLHAATEKSAFGVFPPKRKTLLSLSGADEGSGLLGWFAVATAK